MKLLFRKILIKMWVRKVILEKKCQNGPGEEKRDISHKPNPSVGEQ